MKSVLFKSFALLNAIALFSGYVLYRAGVIFADTPAPEARAMLSGSKSKSAHDAARLYAQQPEREELLEGSKSLTGRSLLTGDYLHKLRAPSPDDSQDLFVSSKSGKLDFVPQPAPKDDNEETEIVVPKEILDAAEASGHFEEEHERTLMPGPKSDASLFHTGRRQSRTLMPGTKTAVGVISVESNSEPMPRAEVRISDEEHEALMGGSKSEPIRFQRKQKSAPSRAEEKKPRVLLPGSKTADFIPRAPYRQSVAPPASTPVEKKADSTPKPRALMPASKSFIGPIGIELDTRAEVKLDHPDEKPPQDSAPPAQKPRVMFSGSKSMKLAPEERTLMGGSKMDRVIIDPKKEATAKQERPAVAKQLPEEEKPKKKSPVKFPDPPATDIDPVRGSEAPSEFNLAVKYREAATQPPPKPEPEPTHVERVLMSGSKDAVLDWPFFKQATRLNYDPPEEPAPQQPLPEPRRGERILMSGTKYWLMSWPLGNDNANLFDRDTAEGDER
ncbi:MAG TPA: hypothetical protein VEJ63_16545 [Planctomycetota bacterium]|nr:hypothetical protein [Planctomycetota bacterium]